MGTKLEHVTFYINGEPIDSLSDISDVTEYEEYEECDASESYVRKLNSDEVTFELSAESADVLNLRNYVVHNV